MLLISPSLDLWFSMGCTVESNVIVLSLQYQEYQCCLSAHDRRIFETREHTGDRSSEIGSSRHEVNSPSKPTLPRIRPFSLPTARRPRRSPISSRFRIITICLRD
jgi:hypothetical protein